MTSIKVLTYFYYRFEMIVCGKKPKSSDIMNDSPGSKVTMSESVFPRKAYDTRSDLSQTTC